MMKAALMVAALIGALGPVPGPGAIPLSDASAIFARRDALCRADDGRLWGVSLCGPLIVADPQTQAAVANRPVTGARREGALYAFSLPAGFPIANAPAQYDGRRWAMVTYPMFGSRDVQAVTLMHESFHRVQPQLGFGAHVDTAVSIAGSTTLATQAGRVWFRGAIHALRVALRSRGAARTRALRDALAMRAYRHALFPQAIAPERQLDLLEGTAEVTGIDAGLPQDKHIAYALYDLTMVEENPSYVREYPFVTGPAYGELLDAVQPKWRRSVRPTTDIEDMAARAYGISRSTPTRAQANAIIARYGGAAIERQEAARAVRVAALDRAYRAEFIAGPTLRLPMVKFSIKFRPGGVDQLGDVGSIYHTLSVSAPWGMLTVSGGDAMITKDFATLVVAAPAAHAGTNVHGRGWELTLSHGTTIVPDARKPGSLTVALPPN